MKAVRIVVFAKAPVPGAAKTRLIPLLGARGAAILAQRMLAHSLRQALAAGVGPVELCATPAPDDPDWKALAIPADVGWSNQGDGDLGARMSRVADRVTSAGEAVLIIGTDCPGLDAGRLRAAAESLQRFDAVWVPTFDGGYSLLGLNRHDPSVFAGISWGTSSVAQATRTRLNELCWKFRDLPTLHDVDEPADLAWLPESWPERCLAETLRRDDARTRCARS